MAGRIKLIADVAVRSRDEVVLVQYRDPTKYDGETGWFLPDDYLRRFEHPDDAARRIVREQVGLDVSVILSHVESFEGNGFWHLTFHYSARLREPQALAHGPAVLKAEWFDKDGMPTAEEVAHGGWALDTLTKISRRDADMDR